jgi:hypothetical protein
MGIGLSMFGISNRPLNLPTDREVLRAIYDCYRSDYPGNDFESGVSGPNDPFIKLDFAKLSNTLGCRPELLHGILYFHLNQKYGYEAKPNTFVRIFEKQVGDKSNCVNFPFLASKLASLEEEHSKVQITRFLSVVAIVLSGIALGARFFV